MHTERKGKKGKYKYYQTRKVNKGERKSKETLVVIDKSGFCFLDAIEL